MKSCLQDCWYIYRCLVAFVLLFGIVSSCIPVSPVVVFAVVCTVIFFGTCHTFFVVLYVFWFHFCFNFFVGCFSFRYVGFDFFVCFSIVMCMCLTACFWSLP